MAENTRKHSVCEKNPYIAVILGIIIPTVFVGIGGAIAGQGLVDFVGGIFIHRKMMLFGG